MLKFKTERIQSEFSLLDNRLRFIIFAIVAFVKFEFGKDVVLTEIWRSKAEQKGYYGNNDTVSVHEVMRGGDMRSSIYTEEEIKKIEKFVNETIYYGSGNRLVCRFHKIKRGVFHFHLQISSLETATLIKQKVKI